MYYDYLIIIGLLISLIAQLIVTTSYNKHKKILNNKELNGFDIARKILDKNKLQDIMILETKGTLSDHYDPSRKVIKLSSDIYNGTSIASLAVAAHECGHAIQDKTGYTPMKIRTKIVPTVNICTKLGYIAIIIGGFFSTQLIEIGIILLTTILIFELITLPVEFNASNRALKELEKLKLIDKQEKNKTKNMLSAAAFTYVASLITSFLQILRLILMFSRRDD